MLTQQHLSKIQDLVDDLHCLGWVLCQNSPGSDMDDTAMDTLGQHELCSKSFWEHYMEPQDRLGLLVWRLAMELDEGISDSLIRKIPRRES